jgi:tetratricopeptide (TPR) repeat protein
MISGDIGDTAVMLGHLELANMYYRWNLDRLALGELQKLISLGYEEPSVRVRIANALAALGEKRKAREHLQAVPPHATEYLDGQKLLISLADTGSEKRALLDQLRLSKPTSTEVMMYAVAVLFTERDFTAAYRVYREFARTHYVKEAPPQPVAIQAVGVMVEAKRRSEAAELCVRMANETGEPGWRYMALALGSDIEPREARKLLPAPEEGTYFDGVYGFLLSGNDEEAAAAWTRTLVASFDKPLPTVRTPNVPTLAKLLAALATGTDPDKYYAEFVKQDFVAKVVGEEMMAYAKTNPEAARKEAAQLLSAVTARLLGFTSISYEKALAVLKARNESHAAAELATGARPEREDFRNVADMVRPVDGVLARGYRGMLLAREEKYAEAIEVLRGVIKEGNKRPVSLQTLARCYELMDRNREAASAYRVAWDATRDPTAANNGAYLLAISDPTNKKTVEEARKWIDEATQGRANSGIAADTVGWIAYLQGRHTVAVAELRRAVRFLRNYPQVHAHLGLAQLAVGNAEPARWHLEAAVALLTQRETEGMHVSADMREAVKLAKDALGRMEQLSP